MRDNPRCGRREVRRFTSGAIVEAQALTSPRIAPDIVTYFAIVSGDVRGRGQVQRFPLALLLIASLVCGLYAGVLAIVAE